MPCTPDKTYAEGWQNIGAIQPDIGNNLIRYLEKYQSDSPSRLPQPALLTLEINWTWGKKILNENNQKSEFQSMSTKENCLKCRFLTNV